MTEPSPRRRAEPSYFGSTLHRWITALFGCVWIAGAIALAMVADPDAWLGASIASLVLGGLGVDSLLAAWSGRRSLVERIGPLP